jgi:RNA polymerase sigma factor (sigma-70 family)
MENEAEVIKKIVAGETRLYEEIIRSANTILYKTGRSYGFDHEETQDLMQDTFIEGFLNLNKFQFRSSVKTWLTKIMLNKCYQRVQKFSYKNEIVQSSTISEKSIPMYGSENENDTGAHIMKNEMKQIIETSLLKIDLDYRMVFLLREVNGLSTAETADALNLTESNVKVRLSRAKTMLKKEIEKNYSMEDIFDFNLIYCSEMVSRVMKQIERLKGS